MGAFQVAVAVVGLGLLIAWHEAGHYIAARALGMRVKRFFIGFGPRLWSTTKDGIEYGIGAFPLGGYVQIGGMTAFEPGALDDPRSYINQPRWARAVVIGAGPAANYLLAFLMFVVYMAAFPAGPAVVVEVAADSLGASAGLVVGDRVARADGRQFQDADDVNARLVPNESGEIHFAVVDKGALSVVAPTLRDAGVVLSFQGERLSFLSIVQKSSSMCVDLSARTLGALASLVGGSDDVSVEGPLGIGRQLTKAVKRGARDLLFMLAYLSVTLGLMNLLPIPALDGIKLLFLGTEGALRRDLSPTLQVWVNALGLLALLGLMLVMTALDVVKMWTVA